MSTVLLKRIYTLVNYGLAQWRIEIELFILDVKRFLERKRHKKYVFPYRSTYA